MRIQPHPSADTIPEVIEWDVKGQHDNCSRRNPTLNLGGFEGQREGDSRN